MVYEPALTGSSVSSSSTLKTIEPISGLSLLAHQVPLTVTVMVPKIDMVHRMVHRLVSLVG